MKCLCIYHIMSYICFNVNNLYSCVKTLWQSLFVQTTTSNVNLSHKHNQLKIQSKKIYPVYNVQVNKWGFLKKNCDAALVRGVLQDNMVLSTGLMMWIGQPKEIRKVTFQVLALVTWDQID